MSPAAAAGLLGVLLILIAYGAGALGKLASTHPAALSLNLVGASLILVSLVEDFNLPAFVMESLWALVALIGLGRWAFRPRP